MGFSEELKLKVKKMADFRCCRCHVIGIDIHHIIPQKDKGPDIFDNAAPLCQNCHDQFGDNPTKRKEIRQMRDHWYEIVRKTYENQPMVAPVKDISDKLDEILKHQKEANLPELKEMLKNFSNMTIDKLTLGTAALTTTNLVNASLASISRVQMGDIHEMILCPNCKEALIVQDIGEACPNCGMLIH